MICAYSLFCYLVWFLVLFALVKIMAFFKGKLVDSIARNLGDPKGIIGFLVMAALRKGNAPIVAITVKHLGVQPDDKVLEVGFGPGVGLEVALRKVEDGSGKVYGLEISQQMVDGVRKRLKPAMERNKLEVHLGSVMELPFPDNYFDRVFHTNCYYFWPSIEQGVSELKRVLKPGGLMATGLVYDALKSAQQKGFIKYGPNWHLETYMEKLSEGGFINVAMETIQKNPTAQACQVIFATKSMQL